MFSLDIVITEFQKRTNPIGVVKHTTWDDLVERLSHPETTDESLDEYFEMTNEKRTEIKDVGGYVAGEFEGGRRNKNLLKGRYVLTIDADDATDHDVADYQAMEDYVFFAHTTHTSTAEHPRLRWLFPLTRSVTASEYKRLVGIAKMWVGAETIDETTDQPERLMFWPSVSWDTDYHFWSGGSVVLNPDEFLDGGEPEEVTEPPKKTSSKPSSDTTEFLEDGIVPEGSRNDTVFRYASKLREAGLDNDILLQSVELFNDRYCSPPLPESEIRTIISSVSQFPKGEKVPFYARDMESDFSDMGKVEKKKKKKIERFEYESQKTIVEKDIAPPSYIIDGLLPIGLGIVVAPPKSKKSWFCLDLAMAVATGTSFLDKQTEKHDVAYFALEDYDYRIKKRSLQVNSDNHTNFADNLFFIKEAPDIQHGFMELLDQFLHEQPKVKLVIIDTFKKISGKSEGKDNAYNEEYDRIGPLQKFAITHDIAMLLVHHTRKGKDTGDFANNASGSLGINATMDVMMFFNKKNRKDDRTELEVVGRDDKDATYIIQFDDEKCRWINLGEERNVRESDAEAAYRTDPVALTIKYYVDQAADLLRGGNATEAVWQTTAQGLLDAVIQMYPNSGYEKPNAVGTHLLSIKDLLEKKDGIRHEKGRKADVRMHVFSKALV